MHENKNIWQQNCLKIPILFMPKCSFLGIMREGKKWREKDKDFIVKVILLVLWLKKKGRNYIQQLKQKRQSKMNRRNVCSESEN